jgi:hypothetical protein
MENKQMSIKDELLALKNSEGFILCEDAVDWAKNHPASHLYKAIEWNDQVAANEYRLHQVRRLIAIHVVSEDGGRQLVSLSIDRTRDGGGYRSLDEVLPIKSLREIMLADAFRELDRIQAKYSRLHELAEVWEATKKVRRHRSAKDVGAAVVA